MKEKTKWQVRKAVFGSGRWMAIPPGNIWAGYDCGSWREAIQLALSNYWHPGLPAE